MPTLGLDPGSRCDGLNGLRFDYVFGKYPGCGFIWNRKIQVKGHKGLRFWIRPDGSDNKLTILFRGKNSGSYTIRLSDINPHFTAVSWDQIFKDKQMPESLDAIGIRAEQNGQILNGTVFLDRFELIDTTIK